MRIAVSVAGKKGYSETNKAGECRLCLHLFQIVLIDILKHSLFQYATGNLWNCYPLGT